VPRVVFVSPGGVRREIDAPAGKTVLEIAWANDVGIEGTCEGCMACSTCHVIVHEDWFDKLDEPSEDEDDMLDLAWGVGPRSRLGCQITITDALDGIELTLPAESNNQMGG
jgi:2Fe-2S ferredoxin